MKTSIDNFLFKSHSIFIDRKFIINFIAIFCIVNILFIAPDMYSIFSSNGFVQKEINNSFILSYQPILSWISNPLMSIGIPENRIILGVFLIYIFSLILIIRRVKPLFFSVMAWFIHLMLINSSYLFSYGADYFISFTLFINIFINFSLIIDKETGDLLHSFIMRFIQIQLCIVYFFAGFGKILGIDWLDGNAIWYVLNFFGSNTTDILLSYVDYPIVFKILSWGVLIELVYPFLIFIPKVRKWIFVMIILIHLSIAIFMKFYTFGLIMILLNIIGFGHYFKLDNILNITISLFKNKYARLVNE